MTLYTRGQATDFIERVFGPGKYSNGGLNVSVLCPRCVSQKPFGYNKKKLVIRTDNGLAHCWCCSLKAKNLVPILKRWHPNALPEYIKTFLSGEQLTDIDTDAIQPDVVAAVLPLGFRLLATSGNNDVPAKRAKRYLAYRGICSQRDLWYWKLGITTEDEDLIDRVIIPSFASNGSLNYWTARGTQKKQSPKYVNPPVDRQTIIFNEINVDWKKPLTLVEGPFDLLKCNENATCLLGSELTSKYLLFQKIVEYQTPIVLALDPDARTKMLTIAKRLSEFDVPVKMLWVPEKRGDVGAMTKEDFRILYTEGVPYNTNTYLLQKIKLLLGQENI